MLPLKLVRSLVFGEAVNNPPPVSFLSHHHLRHHDHHYHTNDDAVTDGGAKINHLSDKDKNARTPLLLFLPTNELVADTYRLATIAREMGMDLYPTPSLSHIIFSLSSPSPSPSPSPSCHTSSLSSCSSTSLSSSLSWYLPNDAVPLPFPSLTHSSLSRLRSFVSLSKGLFRLVFINAKQSPDMTIGESDLPNWDCSSFSLFSRLTGDRIDSMDGFSRALTGSGWTLFKTKKNPSTGSGKGVYLFRKVEAKRVWGLERNGECRVRELRLPTLDFRNAPLRILQYILLMTDDLFYLA